MCKLRYSVSKKFSVAFHKGSNYNYHFIIKKSYQKNVKKQFNCSRQFNCSGENTEEHITLQFQ